MRFNASFSASLLEFLHTVPKIDVYYTCDLGATQKDKRQSFWHERFPTLPPAALTVQLGP